jgi:predicted membrane-bound spermidine synthase
MSLIFFLSGMSALVFEMLFFHLAGLVMGNSVYGTVVVLSSFMCGMAAGNGLAARFGGLISRPPRTYALLEIIVAVSGAGLIMVFFRWGGLLAPVFSLTAGHPNFLHLSRVLASFAMMIVPSIAMGATLPVMIKAAHRREAAFGSTLGKLYGWNTLGAVIGVIGGELIIVRLYGIIGASLAAAFISLTAAALALSLDKRSRFSIHQSPGTVKRTLRSLVSRESFPLLACGFLTGLVLLALEVVWFRFLLLFFYPTSLNFAVMLAVVLAGIGGGGLTASLLFRRNRNLQNLLVPALFLSGILVILTYRFFFPALMAAALLGRLVLSVSVFLMFPVSFLSGAVLTMLGHVLHGVLDGEAEAAGMLIMANTLGAVAGPLAARFLLLPGLGIEGSFLSLAAIYGGAALLLLPVKGLWRGTPEAVAERGTS